MRGKREGLLRTSGLAILLVMGSCVSSAIAAVPPGVWLMDAKVAVQIFDCRALLCGRVIWLKAPLDPQGLLKRDKLNPDPALRDRQICGPTVIWNGQPVDARHWENGWFYNPDDGATYRVSLNLQSDDVLVARIYLGVPLFGKTKTLARIPMGIGAGWC